MIPINWEKAPDWANFIAMDDDYTWYWFAEQPHMEDGEWLPGGKVVESEVTLLGPFWFDSVSQRPS